MQTNNQLREALDRLLTWLDKHGNSFSYADGTPADEVKAIWQERQEIVAQCRAALAEPARNCDRYHTVEEAFAACHEDRGYLSDPVAERRSTISFMLSDAQEMAKFEQCDSAFPDGSCAPVEGRKGETNESK